jgi:hypothetical protein
VNLAFSTKTLRELCESQVAAQRKFGRRVADALRGRLADLCAAANVLELPAGNPREIEGGRHRYYAIDLADGYRLVVCANHTEVPVAKDGGVDWVRVSRVRVHRIEVANG